MRASLLLAAATFCLLAAPPLPAQQLASNIVAAARLQIGVTREYDPAYRKLDYPGGDVARHTGVCSDVVVRALRAVGLDLQKAVHEDMRREFTKYPRHWGLKGPDRNIDHRRVPNLMRYFERHHVALTNRFEEPGSYRAGDIVAWSLGGGLTHIGVVSDRTEDRVPLVLHNIGRGTREENVLLAYRVIGHYRIREAPRR